MRNIDEFYEKWHNLMIRGENDEDVAEEFEKLAEEFDITEYEWEFMCEFSNVKYLEMNKNLIIEELESFEKM